ncbi:MAG: signal peptide peptidase SppA [Acidobacteriota bacterium]
MKKALLVILILTGALALALAGIGIAVGLARWTLKNRVPSKTVLEVNLETPFVEDVPAVPTATVMFQGSPRVRDFVEALERAGRDDRVAGLVAHVGGGGSGLAVVQEMRDAITAFRQQGKFAVAFSETFGEVAPGNVGYYLATAFDEIWLQPSGDLNLTGFLAESLFINGALTKLGVSPRMDHRYEYKNAMDMFTRRKMTAPHREALTRLIESQFGQVVQGIATGRDLPQEKVRHLFDAGPLLGQQAQEAGLVDHMGYWDEVNAHVKEKAGTKAKLLFLDAYLKRAGRPHTKGPTIALIYGAGPVQRGASGYSPLFGSVSMGSDTVASAFRAAVDQEVAAILFRVDSPGGSAVASDTIWRETVRAKEKGIPVIVSMGNVAASGGYWVSMDADRIVAQPGTITASIGVLGGKMLTHDFWDWLGIDWDAVQTSDSATLYSGSFDYTPPEWQAFQNWLDRIYGDFTSKVAAGRSLPLERVKEIARGRVWTGEDALELGLVDELGGFPTALKLAREAAGLAADEPIRLRKFPPEKSFWEKWTSPSSSSSDPAAAAAAVLQILREIQPAARSARQVVAPGARGVLTAPALRRVE